MKISASSAGEDIICLGNLELKIQHSEFLTNRKKRNEIAQIETNQKWTHSVLHIIIYFRTLQLIKQKKKLVEKFGSTTQSYGKAFNFFTTKPPQSHASNFCRNLLRRKFTTTLSRSETALLSTAFNCNDHVVYMAVSERKKKVL